MSFFFFFFFFCLLFFSCISVFFAFPSLQPTAIQFGCLLVDGPTTLLCAERKDIEDICFFEVNTKYISSSELKTSEFSRVRSTSENYYVVNSRDEIYLVFTEKKANFLFILYNAQAFSNAQGRR